MKERKDLIDDALHATKAAAEEGIVPGGGVAFLRAIEAVENGKRQAKGDEKLGFDILAEALVRRPGRSPTTPAKTAKSSSRRSWRTRTRRTATTPPPASTSTCSSAGIIDPTKVADRAAERRQRDRPGVDDRRADDGTEGKEGRGMYTR